MALGAHIQINQTGNVVPTGTVDQARDDVYRNTAVQLVGDQSSGQSNPVWTVTAKPAGSAVSNPITGSTTFAAAFTPDADGSYALQLNVGDGLGVNTQTLVLRVTKSSTGLIHDDGITAPAFGETAAMGNVGGQTRGWAVVYEKLLGAVSPAIPTYAALRLRKASLTKRCKVLGRTSTNDGGQGTFLWMTGTPPADDDGINLIPTGSTSGWWQRDFHGAIMSGWFGMRADGVSFANGTIALNLPTDPTSAFRLTVGSAPPVPFAVGQCIKVQAPNTPATGTVATIVGTAITGTFDVLDVFGGILGHGTNFVADLYVGQIVQCGALYATVTEIASATSARLSAPWLVTTGLTLKKYDLVGTGTAFASELFQGQPVYVNGQLHWVVSVHNDTHAAIWPGQGRSWPAAASGVNLYRNTVMSATIGTVNSTTSVQLTNTSDASGFRLSAAGTVAAQYGTDNSAAGNAFLDSLISQRRAGYCPGSAKFYMFFSGLTPLSNEASGMSLSGDVGAMRNWDYFGADGWMLINNTHVTNAAGTVWSFCKGDGLTFDYDLLVSMQIKHLSLIGPGYGDTRGLGRATGAALSPAAGTNQYDDVFTGNWGRGFYSDTAFNDRVHKCVASGCGVGGWFRNGNSSTIDLQTQGCMIGIKSDGQGFTDYCGGDGQSHMLYAFLQYDAESIRIRNIYWENNPDNTQSFAQSFHFIASIFMENIVFENCHSGDIFVFNPDDNAGTATITNIIDDSCRLVGANVRPKWAGWRSANTWGSTDWTVFKGGFYSPGGGNQGSTLAPQMQFVDMSAGGTFTPDFTKGNIFWFFLQGNDVNIAAPAVNGQLWNTTNPSGIWSPEIEIRIRCVTPALVTFNGAYINVPWTDAGCANGGFASIRFYNCGSGVWEPIGYRPWTVAPPARGGQLTDSTTGSAGSAVADVGASFSQATLNTNFKRLLDRVNSLELMAHNKGLTS